MDEQTRFKTALAALSACAEQQNRRLCQRQVQEFLQDMELTEEQLQLVYGYLASKRIQVEGVELKTAEEEPYTAEEQEFLKQYRKELKAVRRQKAEELPVLLERASDGDREARALLTEHYMDQVLAIAGEYAHGGMLLQDLVQEGNLGLMIGLDTLGLKEEGMAPEDYLENEIHRAIRSALDEQEGEKDTGEQISEKLNRLADSITELTEELERQVTPEELSVYLDMPLEELEDLLRIAGENIETADGQEQS